VVLFAFVAGAAAVAAGALLAAWVPGWLAGRELALLLLLPPLPGPEAATCCGADDGFVVVLDVAFALFVGGDGGGGAGADVEVVASRIAAKG
jgi:hypothetical protein